MRRLLLILLSVFLAGSALPGAGGAASIGRGKVPSWSVQLSAGAFHSREQAWDDAFGSPWAYDGKLGVGYQLTRQWELGLEGGYRQASDNGEVDRKIRVVPAQLYVLYQLRLDDRQLLVPFVAAGPCRYQYWQEVDEEKADGFLWGYHGRGGLKILLDRLDPEVSARPYEAWGLKHTYAVLEGQYARVDRHSGEWGDLGGWSFYGGLALEF